MFYCFSRGLKKEKTAIRNCGLQLSARAHGAGHEVKLLLHFRDNKKSVAPPDELTRVNLCTRVNVRFI